MAQDPAPRKPPSSPRRRALPRALVLLAALAAPVFGSDAGAQDRSPATAIESIVNGAGLGAAQLGVIVLEAQSGRVLYAHEPDLPLNPASNAKIVTAAAALSILGPDHRFLTTLAGRAAGDTVTGPLVLRGTGDPSLSTADLFVLARELVAYGIHRVDGDVVVDDTALGSEHLPPAFEQQPRETAPFRAAVSAVSVDENALALHVAPGPAVGAPALVAADPPGYLELESTLSTCDGGAPSVVLDVTPGASGREHARVRGSFPAGVRGATYRRRLDNPSLAAGYALASALAAAGIRVAGTVRVGACEPDLPTLATHRSAPLSSLLYEVGKESNNFYAEMTLLALAAHDAGTSPVTFQRGAERVTDWLRRSGVPTQGIVIRNGSGLFDANRISARQLATVLRTVWRDPAIRDEYVAQLAVGGDDGTLRNRLRIPGASRWIRAKTGTLDDVIALSGFVLAPAADRTLVFSVVANGVHGRQAAARQLADRIAQELVAANQR